MSYKIIKHKKSGHYRYEVVPSGWEKNNITWWPENGLLTKQKIAESSPEPLGWFQTPSILKRKNIGSFEQAMVELCEMIQNSSTEEEVGVENYDNEADARKFRAQNRSKAREPPVLKNKMLPFGVSIAFFFSFFRKCLSIILINFF